VKVERLRHRAKGVEERERGRERASEIEAEWEGRAT